MLAAALPGCDSPPQEQPAQTAANIIRYYPVDEFDWSFLEDYSIGVIRSEEELAYVGRNVVSHPDFENNSILLMKGTSNYTVTNISAGLNTANSGYRLNISIGLSSETGTNEWKIAMLSTAIPYSSGVLLNLKYIYP